MTFPMMPQANVFPAGPVTQLSRLAVAESGSATITMPAGVRRGDLAVLIDAPTGPSYSTTVYPAGFSGRLDALDGSWNGKLLVSARIIQSASEAGGVLTGANGPDGNSKFLQVYRANVPITGFSGFTTVSANASNGDPGGSSAGLSGAIPALLALAVCGFMSGTAGVVPQFQAMSPAETWASGRFRLRVGSTLMAAGANGALLTCDSDDFGNGNFNACLFIPLRTN